MTSLETKIPPPLIVLMFGAVMWLVTIYLPVISLIDAGLTEIWRYLLAIGQWLISAGLFVSALVTFRSAQTTVNPHHPTKASSLITSGVFRISRNPLYLAMLLILTGYAVWLGNAASILLCAGFVPVMNKLQIVPEERALLTNFGEEFEQYRQRVRRWL